METTPERPSRKDAITFAIAADEASSPRRSSRIKKPPPITPRRFNRFFTPRQVKGTKVARSLRKPLRDVPRSSLNVRQNDDSTTPPKKKRKLSFHSPSSSLPSSPVRRVGFLSSSQEIPQDHEEEQPSTKEDEIDSEASTDIEEGPGVASEVAIKPYRTKGSSASVLSHRLGGRPSKLRTSGQDLYLHETSNFYSTATDINVDNGPPPTGLPNRILSLPFCATSCHTNPLVAVGDEEGHVRLIDSADEYADKFSQSYLVIKPHDNAIMDLEFSEDDNLLATASGDQTCHIIDVKAQRSVWALTGHTSSVKKVQFQPGSAHMLATCARDGAILVWDTRENHPSRPAHTVQSAITQDVSSIQPKNTISDAHLGRLRTHKNAYTGRSDFSVTSLSFVDPTRPHLFATASESDAIVKLWDMRSTHRFKRKTVPLSCTAEPKSHEIHRRFGITSLGTSTDHSRLYTLCRDHTIYAYSTSHLILGSAPEISPASKPFDPRKSQIENQTGLGPLYGFRHPSLQVSTFYPKLSVRRATDSHPELIAVGSSNDCAVLFPTQPRYLTPSARKLPSIQSDSTHRPRLLRMDSQSASLNFIYRRWKDSVNDGAGRIPIYYHGTPLIKGHNKEVTAVSWSSEGNLITISDDFGTRCWREDGEKARKLRRPQEGEAERWGCGWADVGERREVEGAERWKGEWDDEDC